MNPRTFLLFPVGRSPPTAIVTNALTQSVPLVLTLHTLTL
jgi:hypothetical protein